MENVSVKMFAENATLATLGEELARKKKSLLRDRNILLKKPLSPIERDKIRKRYEVQQKEVAALRSLIRRKIFDDEENKLQDNKNWPLGPMEQD